MVALQLNSCGTAAECIVVSLIYIYIQHVFSCLLFVFFVAAVWM